MSKDSIMKEELSLFRKVNGTNKIIETGHQNYMISNTESDVIKNQGISRAKLREFVKMEGDKSGF